MSDEPKEADDAQGIAELGGKALLKRLRDDAAPPAAAPSRSTELSSGTLDRISGLCWQARSAGRDVCALFEHDDEGLPVFCNPDTTTLLVDAMLYLESARFALDVSRARAALDALEEAMPAGDRLSNHTVLEAAQAWCDAGEAGFAVSLADSGSVAERLPPASRVCAVADRAKAAGCVKALDWLTHTVMLLPSASGTSGERLEGIEQFLDCLEKILDTQIEVTGGGASGAHLYRRALVLASRGRIEGALRDLRAAVATLEERHGAVFEQYAAHLRVLESEARLDARLDTADERIRSKTDAEIERLGEAQSDALDEAVKRLRAASEEQISAGLFRVVEILGVFMAIVGLVATTVGAAALGAGAWWQRVMVVAAGSVGAFGFFVALRIVVRPGRETKPSPD